jgi:hypothetical protein
MTGGMMMALPAWWQVVTPHKDIREKSFNEAVFAADLSDVISGTAPEEYRDPRLFFEKTYMTEGLKNLARNVLSRLNNGQGDPVIQLQTPFGGGKTHALLMLYHLVMSSAKIDHMDQLRDFLAEGHASGARVAAFVGTAADPVNGKTPWGEIADQLGCYEIVRDQDIGRVAPGKKLLREVLQRSGPTLILIDELLEYIVKANQVEKMKKITQGQTLAFLQELSEVVATSENSVLVLTLPASILEHYDEDAEKALSQLQKVSGRVESIYVPVEGMEIYEVIRKRLFENLGDSKTHRKIAEDYYRLYQGLGSDVPADVRETSYREKIERAYPFHPEFIDVLYERWGSFPTFQRTRGVLRLLAQIIGDLYERKVSAPLIQSSMVDLSYVSVRREFIKHIGNEYDSIIAADIAGQAQRIDQKMGSEYGKYNIAQGLATAVFLYSFSGGERRGVTLPWLRVALLRNGVPSTIVGDAVSKLEESLWYFHTEKGFYSFKNQPNLNRIIVDREEAIGPDRVRESFDEQLGRLSKGSSFDIYLWPKASGDIPDNRHMKLVLLDPEQKHGVNETGKFTREILDNAGSTFRIYRNTLFIVALDASAYSGLERLIRRSLALQNISGDKNIPLTPDAREELQTKLDQAKKDIPYAMVTAYRHVGWRSNGDIVWRDMGLPTAGQKLSLGERVWQYLKDEERILSSLSPKLILERAFAKDETEKILQGIYDIFLKTPGLPCLESDKNLVDAVIQGVKTGLLGARLGSILYFKEALPDLSMDAVILRPDKAEQEKKAEAEVPGGADSGFTGGYTGSGDGAPSVAVKEGGTSDSGQGGKQTVPGSMGNSGQPVSAKVKRVTIKASVPWDKMSQIVTGVIQPLKACGSDPEITIEINAEAESGFDRITLDSKVKETLQQLGSIVSEWTES